MPVYNKLVRDRIPEIIERDGKSCVTRILDNEEYKQALQAKMYEELKEYEEAKTDGEAVEELADILELMHSLASLHQANFDDIERIRKEKYKKRGGFAERIFLIEVEDN